MSRTPTIAVLVALLSVAWASTARPATLASLVAGGTIETSRLTFDSFTYTGFTGGPAASAINVTPLEQPDGFQGLSINGTFSSTTFSQAIINYRVTPKASGVLFAASITGNPDGGATGSARVDETLSGGLEGLSIFSQVGASSTFDSTTFASPRPSVTVSSLLRLNGFPSNPSKLSILQETFQASALSADFDFDNDADGADFLIWQRGVGTTGSNLRAVGDANSNGAVNGQDLTSWRSQFGQTATPVHSIPEPSGVVMAAGAVGMLWRRRLR